MDEIKKTGEVESRVLTLRGQQVLIDRDVAELYGVTTKEVNQAVRNNPDKFPEDYMFGLQRAEKQELVKKIDRFETLKHSAVNPRAFTEKGMYMLATILRSPMATEVTFAIIETFAKLRMVARAIDTANREAEAGKMPTEAETSKIQAMATDVFKNPLPLRVQSFTATINLGIIKISAEISRKPKE